MTLSITHTPVYCTDLDKALAFYTQRLGFEVRDDVPMGPEMRWLTVHAPGDPHDLLLAAVDHHIPPANRQAMRARKRTEEPAVLQRSPSPESDRVLLRESSRNAAVPGSPKGSPVPER